MCIFGAAPFAACGFFRYHEMTAEQFAWAFVKSEVLYPKKLVFTSNSLYYEAMKEAIAKGEKQSTLLSQMKPQRKCLGDSDFALQNQNRVVKRT